MKIEKIPKGIQTNNERYREILAEKINELIDGIDYWKKAHIQLQDQHIRLQTEVYKSSKPSLNNDFKKVCQKHGRYEGSVCTKCIVKHILKS